jgi:tetratricopeptide (TPR) repeat protein
VDVRAPSVERRVPRRCVGGDGSCSLARSAIRPDPRHGRPDAASCRPNRRCDIRLREAIELEPQSRVAHLFAARAYIEKSLFDAAVAEARAASVLTPANTQALALEACANARRGRRREAQAARARLVQLSRERYVSPYHIASACNGLNESSEAISWLERAFEMRDPMMVFLNVEAHMEKPAG